MVPKGKALAETWSRIRPKKPEIEFLFRYLQPKMNFIDIGAKAGFFTVAVAKRHPTVQVYAFEKCGRSFEVLCENIQLNDLQNVNKYKTAMDNEMGVTALQANASCARTTLDTFLTEHAISKVDVVKLDVDGEELIVLQGARNLLAREDAPLILYESSSVKTKKFNYHPVEIIWLLDEYDYSIFVLGFRGRKGVFRRLDRVYEGVFVAVRPSHPFYDKLQRDVL